MLLDTIKRHDENKTIRLLSIEVLKASNKLPGTIHSVPALMTLPEKKLMFGKSVFDFLLLPGSGKLLTMQSNRSNDSTAPPGEMNQQQGGPSAFVLGANLSDNFSSYDGDNAHEHMNDRVYNWSSVSDQSQTPITDNTPYQEDTRTKKGLPDLDTLRQQRDMELRGEVNVNSMPHPVATRT